MGGKQSIINRIREGVKGTVARSGFEVFIGVGFLCFTLGNEREPRS